MILLPGQSNVSRDDEKPVYARSGWKIPQVYDLPITIELLRIRGNELATWHPRATLRSVSPYPYNCVGMIFAARRAMIEIQHIYDIFREDDYTEIRRDNVKQGDVVVYQDQDGDVTHVAIVINLELYGNTLNIQVLSKWGKDPEFIHYIDDVPPLYGKASQFFTDRRL